MTLTDRILAVLDTLGIRSAHWATQSPGDIAGLVTSHPERLAGVALTAPSRIDPHPFAPLAERLLYVSPAGGMLGTTAARALPRLGLAQTVTLSGYEAESWSDMAADRPDLADVLADHFSAVGGADSADGEPAEGEEAGIRYRIMGNGPVLVLTPLVLAPSQWEPLLPALAEKFRVVALGGPHLGMLSLLEERAALADWRHMCAGMFDALQLSPGERVLDVGCGSGAVAIQFVRHTNAQNPLTVLDISPYLLGEARIATEKAGAEMEFAEASAEELPFPDNRFDAAYTITVLEECNAEKGLAELVRVVKPGGRVGVIVRGTDLHQWWNLPVSPQLRGKISLPAASVSAGGVASAAVYDMAIAAGLRPERMHTFTVASERTDGPIIEYPESFALSLLTPDEQAEYRAAKAEAVAKGSWFMTRGHHCFIGQVA